MKYCKETLENAVSGFGGCGLVVELLRYKRIVGQLKSSQVMINEPQLKSQRSIDNLKEYVKVYIQENMS